MGNIFDKSRVKIKRYHTKVLKLWEDYPNVRSYLSYWYLYNKHDSLCNRNTYIGGCAAVQDKIGFNFYFNNEYYDKGFKQTFQDRSCRFVSLILEVVKPRSRYINVLLIDKERKTIERYSPFSYDNDSNLDSAIRKMFIDGYYITQFSSFTPTKLPKMSIPKKELSEIWSVWYLDMRLSYPHLDVSDLHTKALIEIEKEENLSEFLCNYANHILELDDTLKFSEIKYDIEDVFIEKIQKLIKKETQKRFSIKLKKTGITCNIWRERIPTRRGVIMDFLIGRKHKNVCNRFYDADHINLHISFYRDTDQPKVYSGNEKITLDNYQKMLNDSRCRFVYFIIIFNTVYFQNGEDPKYHANTLIVDKKKKTIERFEPSFISRHPKAFDRIEISEKVSNYIRKRFVDGKHVLKYIDYSRIINPNVQNYDSNSSPLSKEGGYCHAWSYWYLDMRLSYPELDPITLINDTVKQARQRGVSLYTLILEYSNDAITSFFKEFGLDRLSQEEKMKVLPAKIKELEKIQGEWI